MRSAPYGADVNIEKVEYVGHIQKGMGGRLGRKIRDLTGKRLSDGKRL